MLCEKRSMQTPKCMSTYHHHFADLNVASNWKGWSIAGKLGWIVANERECVCLVVMQTYSMIYSYLLQTNEAQDR